MEIRYATGAGTPGRPNDDYVVCGPDWVAVFDGATAPAGVDSGCVHDVPWLVRHLAAEAAALMPLRESPLDDLLAAAIGGLRARHGGACDLDNPDSPSATATLCRFAGGGPRLEYLVLADSPVVIRDSSGEVRVFRDDALERLPGGRPYSRELVRKTRNAPGGFWVASTVPEAAYHAVRGTCDLGPDGEAAVLTDGASRYAEMFGHSWESLLGLLRADGPGGLIAAVRDLERACPPPRSKPHDDATAVYWQSRSSGYARLPVNFVL